MDDTDLIAKLYEVARDAAHWMLNNVQEVPPHVLTVATDGTVSQPYFPHEHLEGVGWGELLEAAAGHARDQVATGQVVAVAVGVELQNEGQRGVGIQVETRSKQLFQILPVVSADEGQTFGTPLDPDSFLFDLLFVPGDQEGP